MSADHLRSIAAFVPKKGANIGSEKISIHKITSKSEPFLAFANDLFKNYVSLVLCVTHTHALCLGGCI